MNKAKDNPAPLVPLSVQARRAIVAANERVYKNTRAFSTRRRLALVQVAKARVQFMDGDFVEAKRIADAAAPKL